MLARRLPAEVPEPHFRAGAKEVLAAMLFASGLFVGLVLLNPDWPYAPVGWVDMHVSRFFADAPILLRRNFSDAPSGDLFSIYLPMAILGRAFGYFWGNLIWKWLAFGCTATAFFTIVRRFASRSMAAFGTLLFVSYQYFLIALSGDYTDSRVVFYFSVALALSLYSSRAVPVLASGFFLGLSAIASLQSAFLAPAFIVLCFISFWEENWRPVIIRFLLLAAGVALCFAAAALYNHVFFGKWFFLANSMEKAKSFLGQDRRFLNDWMYISRWTVIPLFAAVMSLLTGIRELAGPSGTTSRLRLGAFAGALATTAIYLYLFFVKHQESISNPWYLANTIPVMFLGLVAALQYHWDASSKRTRWIAMAIVTAALFHTMYLYNTGGMQQFTQEWLPFDNIIVFLVLALLAYCLVFETNYLIPVTLLFVALNMFSGSSLKATIFDTRGRAEFRVVEEEWIAWVRQVDPQRRALLWYNAAEQPFCASLATASHSWVSRLVNDSFPDCERPVASAGGRAAQLPKKGDSLIVISARSDAAELAITALKGKDIHAVVAEHREFVSGPLSFTATILRCD